MLLYYLFHTRTCAASASGRHAVRSAGVSGSGPTHGAAGDVGDCAYETLALMVTLCALWCVLMAAPIAVLAGMMTWIITSHINENTHVASLCFNFPLQNMMFL